MMKRRALLAGMALAAAAPGLLLAAGREDEPKVSADYLPIQTLVGTVVRSDGRRGSLSVECGLHIPDRGLRARAAVSIPRLRAAYAQFVRSYAAGLPSGVAPNAEFIRHTLQQHTDRVLGRPGARLLLGAILVN